MITENLSTLKIHRLTQAQYDREKSAGRLDENALYLTPDEAAVQTNNNATVSVTVADGVEYNFPNATTVTITCPTSGSYECWIRIGDKLTSAPTINNAKRMGGNVTYDISRVTAMDIAIKDGYYTIGVSYQ